MCLVRNFRGSTVAYERGDPGKESEKSGLSYITGAEDATATGGLVPSTFWLGIGIA